MWLSADLVCIQYRVTPFTALHWCLLRWLVMHGRLHDDDGEIILPRKIQR